MIEAPQTWNMSDPLQRRRAVLTTLMPGFLGHSLPDGYRFLYEQGLGGFCIFGHNVESAEQLRALNDQIRAANPRAIISMDEEGGDVTRLHLTEGSPFPGNAVLGRIDDVTLTEQVGGMVGTELREVGVGLDLAPDVDINSNSDNPVIGVRSFGSEPDRVSRHTVAWLTGLRAAGVAACVKHFPGHGDTDLDSHHALPTVDRSLTELRSRELVPFAAAIGAGVESVMTSHILLPQLDSTAPATFSSRILQGVLRGDEGFAGLIVTDALDMAGASAETGIPEAAVRSLIAGCDLLCLGSVISTELICDVVAAILNAMEEGRLAVSRVAHAATRVQSLAATLQARWSNRPRSITLGGPERVRLLDRVQGSFDVKDVVDRYPGRCASPKALRPAIVRLTTAANIAVGQVPWGPFAYGFARVQDTLLDQPTCDVWERLPQITLDASEPARTGAALNHISTELAPEQPVIVIGQAVHRSACSRTIVDALRERRPTITVDMGWPDDARAYADIATFGASWLVGQALIRLLAAVVTGNADTTIRTHGQRQ